METNKTQTAPKTKAQMLKALAAAGLTAHEITGRGDEMEVTLNNEEDMETFRQAIANWGGFRCGWGGWVLRPNYQTSGDWNDVSSRCHY